MQEDEIDIELRPAVEVAERCVILAALLRRLSVETLAAAGDKAELDGEAFDVRGWLQTESLWDRLTAPEIDFFDRSVGQFDDDAIVTVAWQAEGVATLGWCLGLTDRLPPGDLGDVAAVVKTVPAPWEHTSAWVQSARLRTEDEIARERDRAEVYEWRIGVESVRRAASGQEETELAATIAEAAREAIAAGMIEELKDGDFTIGDSTLESFDEERLERLAALAGERLRALNWICGFGDSWDQVPLDV